MEASLEKAVSSGQRVRKYSSGHHLRKDMVGDHPFLSVFVSGSSTGVSTRFHCMICRRNVVTWGRKFIRYYSSDRHWERDVAYRFQNDMSTYDRQMEPMDLSTGQRDEYMNREKIAKDEGFSFPEDLLPSCTRVGSTDPLLTLVNCIAELCRCGGSYVLLRKLWGNFRATLGREDPLYNLHWNRSETLVSIFGIVRSYV